MTEQKTWKISVIPDSEAKHRKIGKWWELLSEVKNKIKDLEPGKSLKIEFPDASQMNSFQSTAQKAIKGFVVGKSSLDKAVFIGRNTIKRGQTRRA